MFCPGWHAPARDNATGAPVADPQKFPNGVKDLADKIHGMGLKVRHHQQPPFDRR
jgi:hypothetical protein